MIGSFHYLYPQLILKFRFRLGSTRLDGFYEQIFEGFICHKFYFVIYICHFFLLHHMVLILVHVTFWIFRPRMNDFPLKLAVLRLKTYLVYVCFCFDVLWS